MARKEQKPLAESPPPAASSSDEEEDDEEADSDSSSSSSDEQQPPPPPQPQKQPPSHSHSSDDDEEVEEEDEEEEEEEDSSDDEQPPNPLPQKKKPPSPKPTQSNSESSDSDSDSDPPPPKKPSKSKPTPAPAPTPPVTVLASPAPTKPKRPRPVTDTPTKKAKKEPAETPLAKKQKLEEGTEAPHEESKKPLFQRIWSEEDEVAVLQSMIEYRGQKGVDPLADGDGFSEFVKKSVHADVSRAQIMSKIRSLRRKFETAMRRKKQVSDPHGLKIIELGKQIWGESGDAKSNGDVKGKTAKKLKVEKEESGEEKVEKVVVLKDKGFNLETLGSPDLFKNDLLKNVFLMEGVKLMDEREREVLVGKWRKHNIEEMELYLKRVDLIKETGEKVLDVMKSQGW